MNPRRHVLAAAILGFTGVALGAFGAHGLKGALEAGNQVENWKTAVFYQLAHAIAILAIAQRSEATRVSNLWLAGVLAFSGSLYCLALGGPVRYLWPVTPLGGLLLLAGWGQLAWSTYRQRAP